MSTRSAKHRPYSFVCSGGALLLVFGIGLVCGSDASGALYLLAATPTPNWMRTYPARLYTLKPDKTLELVREVVPASDGVYSVSDGGGVLSLLYPWVTSRNVAIVHKNDPNRADTIYFNPEELPLYGFAVSLAAINGETVQILPLNRSSGPGWPKTIDFVRAILEPATASPRVAPGSGNDYEHVLVGGATGGPMLGVGFLAAVEGNDIVLDAVRTKPKIDALAPNVPIANKRVQVLIVAANSRFLIILKLHTKEEMNSLPGTTQNYVHDRRRNLWKTVELPGNESRQRLFGDWLATIEQMWSPNNQTNPGRDEEKAERMGYLDTVASAYKYAEGADQAIPGVLILTNLDDGRRITMETHMEDSEILDVDHDQVLYRVNDTIYQAVINGTALGPATIIAKDKDVPEVHWVFRSK